jgi:hypothetical protein
LVWGEGSTALSFWEDRVISGSLIEVLRDTNRSPLHSGSKSFLVGVLP